MVVVYDVEGSQVVAFARCTACRGDWMNRKGELQGYMTSGGGGGNGGGGNGSNGGDGG